MITESLLQFSGTVNPIAGQSLALAAGTYTSTNIVDTLAVGPRASDLGAGRSLEIAIQVTQVFAGGTSLQVQLVCADDTGISVNVTPIVLGPVTPLASLGAGSKMVLHVDRAAMAQLPRRYLALQYIIVGTMTAGAVFAGVVSEVQDSGNGTLYMSGFTVA